MEEIERVHTLQIIIFEANVLPFSTPLYGLLHTVRFYLACQYAPKYYL